MGLTSFLLRLIRIYKSLFLPRNFERGDTLTEGIFSACTSCYIPLVGLSLVTFCSLLFVICYVF